MRLEINNEELEAQKHFLFNCRLSGLASRGRTRLVQKMEKAQKELNDEIVEKKREKATNFREFLQDKMEETLVIEIDSSEEELIRELYQELQFYQGRMHKEVAQVYDDLMIKFDKMIKSSK